MRSTRAYHDSARASRWRPLAVAFVLGICLGAPRAAADTLYILHTNDLHGHLTLDDQQRGGLERIATVLRVFRESFPARVLVLDAGDIAQGTPLSNHFRGAPMIEGLLAADYDAVVPGNHEFDWGPAALTEILSPKRLPVICANLVAEDGSLPFPAFRVVERAGARIGLIGLIAADTPSVTGAGNTRGYRFLDPVEAVRRHLPELEKADLLIALSHLGVEEDRRLARAVPKLSLIVGGHSHTELLEGIQEGPVTIVQTGGYGRFLGLVEVELERTRVVRTRARLIRVAADVPPDPEVAAIAERYRSDLGADLEVVVAQAAEPIPLAPGPGSLDGSLGSLLADVLRVETGAQVGLFNHGGIREDLLPAGPVTRDRVFRLLPFDDPVVKLQLSGAALLETLRHGFFGAPGVVQVSGLTAVVDRSTQSVVEVRVNGALLDPKAAYEVAVPGFMAGGGDGYAALREGQGQERYGFPRQLFESYARRRGLQAPETGRLRDLGGR